ncbi:TPA: carbamoyltransferase HypF [Candidatus Woesearchaeota archaeon]|nr:carbamoyltransferase HypF [Candidatus Woesearchaeota archaeon]
MYKFLIKGVVQGVGFRPYIYNACVKAGLNGYVQNTGDGVTVVVDDDDAFLELLKDIPPLARIDSYSAEPVEMEIEGFSIIQSSGRGQEKGSAEIPPDLFLCEDCLRELKKKGDRREGYFFITCTNCGPRFSIAERSPYDRETTSMEEFKMCKECRKEYTNPTDRRYHAQTIACHDCGPKITLHSDGKPSGGIKEAAELIAKGEVVAVKGVGGFHLAARADTARRVRDITRRQHKPYAVMVKDAEMAREIAEVSDKEQRLLESVERPIVLLKKKKDLVSVSELDTIGVMLPYTALHHLLFEHLDTPLVMTSANMPDWPITTEKQQQFVGHILDHDRKILNHVDDSVIKEVAGKTLMIRRSRGYVPKSIPLPWPPELGDAVALGAEMNNTFCIVKDGRAILSQHMGTLSNYDSYENMKKAVKKALDMSGLRSDTVKTVICDMHPGYNTTAYAEELAKELGAQLVKVQHHKAHAYAAAAEHGLKSFAAIVCDGLGYGEDGNIWGGEIFIDDKRVAHLEEHVQLGGDAAAQRPARMLMSILSKFMTEEGMRKIMLQHFDGELVTGLERQMAAGFNCPTTTSCGRVLDAAAAFLGICEERTYEGRPAMMLEAKSAEPYEIEPVINRNGDLDVLLTTPLFKWLVLNSDKDPARLAATVQMYIAKGLYMMAAEHAQGRPIVFSGGCAYNKIMTKYLVEKGVLVNEKVPCGDGGVAFGQVAYYASKSCAERSTE